MLGLEKSSPFAIARSTMTGNLHVLLRLRCRTLRRSISEHVRVGEFDLIPVAAYQA